MVVSSAWYFRLPGGVYAFGPLRFKNPVSETEVRAYLLQELQWLPVGTEVWREGA